MLEGSALAYRAMVLAALGLLKTQDPDARSDPETVFSDFERQFIDTTALFRALHRQQRMGLLPGRPRDGGASPATGDEARRRVEEAQLFIEASHACYTRLRQVQGGGSPAVTGALASTT